MRISPFMIFLPSSLQAVTLQPARLLGEISVCSQYAVVYT